MQNINMMLFMSPLCGFAEKTVRASEHFPEKWPPVFRRKCDPIYKTKALPDST
jgi:hypothetical protein